LGVGTVCNTISVFVFIFGWRNSGKGDLRVNDHDLSVLTVRARRTVQEHWVSARNGHVEGADISLPVLKGDVAAVHTGLHGRACLIHGRLGDGVVSVAELELHDVAHRGDYRVGDECVLGPADDDGDDLVGAAMGPELWERGDRGCEGEEEADGFHDWRSD